MSQGDILKLLERKQKWLRTKQIQDVLKVGNSGLTLCLRKLLKQGFVMKKEIKENGYRKNIWRAREYE